MGSMHNEIKTYWLSAYCPVCAHTIQALAYWPTKVTALVCPTCGRVCEWMSKSDYKLTGTQRANRVTQDQLSPPLAAGDP